MRRSNNRASVFLTAYRETGLISRAAKAAGVNRALHYHRYKRDPQYRQAFDSAHDEVVGSMEDEARRRAVEGVEKPLVYQGMIMPEVNKQGRPVLDGQGNPVPAKIREYSDSLLMFVLRGEKPEKYRERFRHEVSGTVNVTRFKGSLETLLAHYHQVTSGESGSEE